VGITDVIGEFDREEVVSIFNEVGEYTGAGITAYSSEDIKQIRGQHSSLIGEILSYDYGQAIVESRSILLSPSAIQAT
jgi:glutamate 5-kinase